MGDQRMTQGFFSLLRWRPDPTRDEAKNVAVLLVSRDGDNSGLRHAPLSQISPRLNEQGILDDVLVGLSERLSPEQGSGSPDPHLLDDLHRRFTQSLVVTAPQNVAVSAFDETLNTLYKAYVAPRSGPRPLTKAVAIDRVVAAFRKQGLRTQRSSYVEDFIFDVVVENGARSVVEVLSFVSQRKDGIPFERDAGHFLYAVRQLELPAKAVIQPPSDGPLSESYDRVSRWFEAEKIPSLHLDDLLDDQQVLDFTHD